MSKEKARFEVLLERIEGKVDLLSDGHITIRREMQEIKNDLTSEIKETNDKLQFVAKELSGEIKETNDRLTFVAKELTKEIREVNQKLEYVSKDLGKKIDNVNQTLKRHIQLPAHA